MLHNVHICNFRSLCNWSIFDFPTLYLRRLWLLLLIPNTRYDYPVWFQRGKLMDFFKKWIKRVMQNIGINEHKNWRVSWVLYILSDKLKFTLKSPPFNGVFFFFNLQTWPTNWLLISNENLIPRKNPNGLNSNR